MKFNKISKYRAKAFWLCLKCGHKFPKLRAKKPQRLCVKCESLDIEFWASGREHEYWGKFQLLQKAEKITNLLRQQPLHFKVNEKIIFAYICDMIYRDCTTGETIYCEVKGWSTPLYRLKRRLIEAQLGIKITEIK